MKKTIAFQGAVGANSHLACQKYYANHEAIAYASFSDVFAAVEKGEVEKGMIPLENSYAGRVSEIHICCKIVMFQLRPSIFFQFSIIWQRRRVLGLKILKKFIRIRKL